MNNKKLFVFFGATGNLFSEKIFPAFYHLIRRNKIDPFHIIAIGRRFSDESSYRLFLSQLIEKKIPDMNFSILNQLFQNTSYYRGDIDEPQTFSSFTSKFPLQNYREIIFYLSTIPSLYAQTIQLIHNLTSQILAPIPIKIVVEKPFGFDKNSFKELNRLLNAFISEKNIFYVDHYLGKDTVQNIIILKAENLFIEKLLSAQYVKEIRFIVSEKDGVGSRGKFYEETGAIRDVLQNHILQLISLIAMDIPSLCQDDKKECSFFIEMMQQKKISVIKHLELPPAQQIILGQYQSYKQEIPHSTNQTFLDLPDRCI